MFDLSGKAAIVTGGASGIGAAIARRLASAGADVLVADIAGETAGFPGVAFRRVDVGDGAAMAALCVDAVDRFGRLDIMVNNAGVASAAPLSESSETRSARFWRVHVLGVQAGIREAAARMQRGGTIINISSITALRGFLHWGEYAATKAAIISLTQTAAIEYAGRGLRVNCIAPGIIDTPLAMNEAPDMVQRNAQVFAPLGRIGRPEEVAAAVHYMASDDAGYTTGQTLLVDGGWSVGTSVAAIELALSTADQP